MLRKVVALGARQPWQVISRRRVSAVTSSAVDSILLRSLKDHYLEVSKMNPPPKVSPPAPFTVVKGALDSNGPVLKRTYRDEEINIYVMRLNFMPGGGGGNDGEDVINQLFLHVDIAKPGQEEDLHVLCGLYPDALGIHSVTMRPKLDPSHFVIDTSKYNGPIFENVDERMRDALHSYIEERGVNESLFPFLQAWLYVKDHRGLMQWFKTVGTFINERKQAEEAC